MQQQKVFIVTEGSFNVGLLEKLMPQEILSKVKFFSSLRHSDAMLIASTLLSKYDCFVVLVLDTNRIDKRDYEERYQTIEEYLLRTAPASRFKILLGQPSIESIFFENKAVLEKIIGKELSDTEIEIAKGNPRRSLMIYLKLDNLQTGFLDILSPDTIEKLRKVPFVKSLSSNINRFVAAA